MGYQSVWNHRTGVIEQVLEDIKNEYPQAWQAAHNPQRGDKTQREEYCQRVCARLRDLGIPAGMNGKRGNPNDLSEDIIALPRPDHVGAPDTSGKYPSIEIRDVIASAGPDREGNQAGRPYFGDVTQKTLDNREKGCYVEPIKLSGQSRPPVGGEVPTPPIVTPTPPSSALEARIQALEAQNLELRTMVANALSGIGAVATQVGTLSGALLDGGGAFDTMTKRIFGVDGSENAGVAEEVVIRLQNLEPKDRRGALEGCRVVSYLRR
ncbi:MAG TPA: hypothetical protein VGK73_32450 [Polyangiaceae bacterium]